MYQGMSEARQFEIYTMPREARPSRRDMNSGMPEVYSFSRDKSRSQRGRTAGSRSGYVNRRDSRDYGEGSRGMAGAAQRERVLTPQERRRRQERMRLRRRKKRIRAAVVFVIYAVMALAIVGGLVFLGKGIKGLGQLFAGTDSVNASAADIGQEEAGAVLPAASAPLVFLDAGHGGNDQGTSYQDTLEKDINLAVAKKVQKLLADMGYRVQMTRETDTKVDKYDRASMANEAGADIFVSIHCNYLEQGEASGIEIYYDPGNVEGGILGRQIMNGMVSQTKAKDRDVRTEDFVVTRETTMASVLVELGYLSDSSERGKLLTDSYQNLLAKGIAEGVQSYLKNE